MKKVLVAVTLAVFLVACGEPKVINGKYYPTCGLLSDSDCKSPEIRYKASAGNVFWGVVLSESFFAPLYFFGFSLYNPVGPK